VHLVEVQNPPPALERVITEERIVEVPVEKYVEVPIEKVVEVEVGCHAASQSEIGPSFPGPDISFADHAFLCCVHARHH
jgi:hypothetical protein